MEELISSFFFFSDTDSTNVIHWIIIHLSPYNGLDLPLFIDDHLFVNWECNGKIEDVHYYYFFPPQWKNEDKVNFETVMCRTRTFVVVLYRETVHILLYYSFVMLVRILLDRFTELIYLSIIILIQICLTRFLFSYPLLRKLERFETMKEEFSGKIRLYYFTYNQYNKV